ncbi:MAG TPA: uroporphyrinogen decarboxylase family protein [Planctomycetota bacterium]|nr:uroporphyrinogen decarboxylase family protein [Planctomycetota bacterium]
MLPKERVAAIFEHRATDRVPLYMGSFSSRVASAVLGRPDACVGGGVNQFYESKALWEGPDAHAEFVERAFRDAMDLPAVLDLDYVRPAYWRLGEKPTRRMDDFTFLYGNPDGAYRVMRLDPETELYQVVDQQPRRETTLEDIERHVAALERGLGDYSPADSLVRDWSRAMTVHGATRAVHASGVGVGIPNQDATWLMAVALRPDLVARYLDAVAERACRNAELLGRVGARYAHGGGDFAGTHGPNYSPRAFHELMLPALQKVSDACHRHGVYHMFASDGNLWPVADDLFGASGVDAFYEIDLRAGMDLRRLRERFPRLTLLGGISSYTLHRGTRDDVVRETLAALEAARELGSIMVGCSNLVVCQTPMENFWAMTETLWGNR